MTLVFLALLAVTALLTRWARRGAEVDWLLRHTSVEAGFHRRRGFGRGINEHPGVLTGFHGGDGHD